MKILAVCGSSGGHIYPALSFLDALKDKEKSAEFLLVLPKRAKEKQMAIDSYPVSYISTETIKFSCCKDSILGIIKFIRGSIESLILLLKFKPDVVIGFGTLDSLPIVMLSWFFRIKTIIHEQNVILGRANRLLSKFVDRIAISFDQTKNYLKVDQNKIVLTGNPIRKELRVVERDEALRFFGFQDNKLTILVMGGSQGSNRINLFFLEALRKLENKSRLQIIHLAGSKDLGILNEGYRNLGVSVKFLPFLKEMQYAYSISDLAICRAGATTVSELINFKVPSIIIPYPFAYQHQLANAQILSNFGVAILIKDNDLSADLLTANIEDLIGNLNKITLMRAGYDKIPRIDSGSLLANEVLSLFKLNC